MNTIIRKYRKRASGAALVVLAYFLVQIAVINPVFCYPTSGGANIEMCVLDFQCPCVCDHDHDGDHQDRAEWRDLCDFCLDVPISLGNDLLPDIAVDYDGGDVEVSIDERYGDPDSYNPLPFLHPKDYRPPGIPPLLQSGILRC